jgi:hypothetical protein
MHAGCPVIKVQPLHLVIDICRRLYTQVLLLLPVAAPFMFEIAKVQN